MTLFAQPGISTDFIQQLARRLAVTPQELTVLGEIISAAKPIRRRQDIVTEGRQSRRIFIVVDGLLICYRIMRDGQRQVVNVIVPGDVAGFPSCFFDGALYSIRTLTNSVVATLSLNAVSALFASQPQLAGKLFWLFSSDAAVCAEHVVVVGRRSARERIAHFFLELLTRLQAIGMADETSFDMPFSQDVICDALGLSLAYVNRELRVLTNEGLVTIDGRKVIIQDLEGLAELADFEQRYLKPSPAGEFFASIPQPWQTANVSNGAAPQRRFAAL